MSVDMTTKVLNVAQHDTLQQNKFTQLVINECAELTLDYKNDQHYNGWIEYRDHIRKHFSTPYEIGRRLFNEGYGVSDIWGAVKLDSDMEEAQRGYDEAKDDKQKEIK